MFKKIMRAVSMILVIAMLTALVPAAVFAENDNAAAGVDQARENFESASAPEPSVLGGEADTDQPEADVGSEAAPQQNIAPQPEDLINSDEEAGSNEAADVDPSGGLPAPGTAIEDKENPLPLPSPEPLDDSAAAPEENSGENDIMPVNETAEAADAGNVTWDLSADGTLTISGQGEMTDTSWDKSAVKRVIINEGVTSISDNAFYNCEGLTEITIPESITSIGSRAFENCTSLPYIYIPENVANIGLYAYCNCANVTKIEWNAINANDSINILAKTFYNLGQSADGIELVFGDKVEIIPQSAFDASSSNNAKLISVKFGSGLKEIGRYAFKGRNEITEITIPSGTEIIGGNAFEECSALNKVIMPASVTSVGVGAFGGCSELKTAGPIGGGYNLEFGWTDNICYNAFAYGESWTKVVLPEGVTSISDNAFNGCEGLTEITIPESITSIGRSAFENCTSLPYIYIPENVANIGLYAYCNCANVTKIEWNAINANDSINILAKTFYNLGQSADGIELVFGDKVEIIPQSAFDASSSNNAKLISVKFGSGLKEIGRYAFKGRNEITEITIPSGTEIIGGNAFEECSALNKVIMPASVTSVGSRAFSGCPELKTVGPIGGGYNFEFAWIDNICYETFAHLNSWTKVVLPEGVTSIDNSAFDECAGLTEITIPETVTMIGDHAFDNCTSLSSIYIPENVEYLGLQAYDNCTNVTKIEWNAVNAKYGNDDNYIDNYTFRDVGINADGVEVVFGDKVETIPRDAFNNNANLTSVKFGSGLKTIKRSAFLRQDKITEIEIPEGTETIEYSAFNNCVALSKVIIPASVTSIGENAFDGCSILNKVTISANAITIGEHAFDICPELKTAGPIGGGYNLEFGWTDNNINYNAFAYGESWTKIVLPEGITRISDNAFFDCAGLIEITIPESMTSIGNRAFENCTSLSYIYIPENVTNIGWEAYSYCTNVTKIEWNAVNAKYENYYYIHDRTFQNVGQESDGIELIFGDKVEIIPQSAFSTSDSNNAKLSVVTVPVNVKNIGSNAFNGQNDMVMRVYPDSYAEQYAVDNNINYELILGSSIRLSVLMPDGSRATDGYTVNWYEKGSNNVIGTGTILRGTEEGKEYEYEIVLDKDLSMLYYQPEKQAVKQNEKDIKYTLRQIPIISVSGNICDEYGNPLKDVTITLKQDYNGKYTNEIQLSSDVNGFYNVDLKNVPTTVFYAKNGYYGSSIFALDGTEQILDKNIGKSMLVKLPDEKITMSLKLYSAAKNGEPQTISEISDANNFDFELYNITQNKIVTEFDVQYPYIVLRDSTISSGDEIEIKAIDKNNQKHQSHDAVLKINDSRTGKITLDFVENGKFEISGINGNNENTIMLFSENGLLINSYICNDQFVSDNLPEGRYMIALMKKTRLFNRITDINKLGQLGLRSGNDYIVREIDIKNGVISEINDVDIPDFDETKFVYTENDKTSFEANRSSASTGTYVSVRAEYSIDAKYTTGNQYLTFEIPKGVDVTNGSVTVDGQLAIYSFDNNTLTVKTNKKSATVRFYLVATDAGTYNINSYLTFDYSGSVLTQPIGSVMLEAQDALITVPDITAQKNISAKGVTIPKSTIDIYDNDEKVATTTSNANGTWLVQFDLIAPSTYSYHNIYAIISNENIDNTIKTINKELIYDEEAVQVSSITMINTAHGPDSLQPCEYVCYFDCIDQEKAALEYWYWPAYPTFTFKVEFKGNVSADEVHDVYVVTKNSSGTETYVPVSYDDNLNLWIGTHDYDTDNIPVSVSAEFCTLQDPWAPYNELKKSDEFISQMDVETSFTDEGIQYVMSKDGETMTYTVFAQDFDTKAEMDEYVNSKYTEIITEDSEMSVYKANQYDLCYTLITNDGKYYAVEMKNNSGTMIDFYGTGVEIADGPLENQMQMVPDEIQAAAYKCDNSDCNCMEGIDTDDAIDAFALMYRNCRNNQDGYGDALYGAIRANLRSRRIYANTTAILATYNTIDAATSNLDVIIRGYREGGFTAGLAGLATLFKLHDIYASMDQHRSALNQYRALFRVMKKYRDELQCGCDLSRRPMRSPQQSVNHTLDPSGYVYEAVPSNRIMGVTATLYSEEDIVDDFGFPTGEKHTVKWNASEYDQINPTITDINGEYAWFVPDGRWQVMYEKDGYETVYSEWLSVPPPQTEVNTAMVSKAAPVVERINAYNDGVEIVFSQYMKPDTVSADTVAVSAGGAAVSGTVEALDAEYNLEGTEQFARRFMFRPNVKLSGEVSVRADGCVNYAGTKMTAAYSGSETAQIKPESVSISGETSIAYDADAVIPIRILPAEAGANKKLTITASSPSIASISGESVVTDAEGRASVTVHGNLPGTCVISVSLDGTSLEGETIVNVGGVDGSVPGKQIVPVEVSGAGAGHMIIVAAYDGDVMVGHAEQTASGTGADVVELECDTSAKTVKIMEWESLESMKPVKPAEERKIN